MIMDNFDSPFLYNRPQMTVEAIKKSIVYKLIFLIGRSPREASQRDWLNATLHAVRDLVTEGWITTARQNSSGRFPPCLLPFNGILNWTYPF